MKVICIDSTSPTKNGAIATELTEGVEYSVVGSRPCTVSKNLCYQLAGFFILYESWRFVPLSDIDEKEFERNYNNQTA